MRLAEVYRYELDYTLRRPLTWILFVVQGLFALWTSLATNDNTAVHYNAPIRLAGGAIIAGMLGILISAALFGEAALRDVDAEMDPLLYTSRLTKSEYLGGRFLAALTVNAIVLVAIPLAHVIGGWMTGPQQMGPFRIAALAAPFLFFALPNVILFGALLFTVAALTRQTIPVYLAAIAFFIGYLVAVNNMGGIENSTLYTIADPLGIGTLQRLTKYWAPAEENTQLVGFPALLILNRVVWLLIAAAILAFLDRRFRFAHSEAGGGQSVIGRRRTARAQRSDAEYGNAIVSRPAPTPQRFAPTASTLPATAITPLRQTTAVAQRSLEELALTRVFLACVIVAAGLALLFGWNVSSTVFDTSSWPITYLVAAEAMGKRIGPVVVLLIALFAGELVWKDRAVGVAEIADATPVSNSAILVGRFIALVVMIVALQTAFLIAGILLQTLQGYHHFELGLYLRILFGVSLARWILIAALAMAVHVIVNQKYLGHVIVVIAYVFTMVPQFFHVYHHLLIYASSPSWTYSAMNGFGQFVAPMFWFFFYWSAWALLLGVIANLLWVRGRETAVRQRLLAARSRFVGPIARAAGVAVALILVLGGFIFYNTNVLNDHRSPEEAGRQDAEYERMYKRFETTPQPTIEAVQVRDEIHPEQPGVDVHGTYRLVNRTTSLIDSVHVVLLDRGAALRALSFDRGSTPVVVDDDRQYRIYRLERPLQPGDSVTLTFDLWFGQRGFRNEGQQKSVVGNGSSLSRNVLPAIGYQPFLELTDDEARQHFGLGAQRAPSSEDPRQSRWLLRNEDLIDYDEIVGTPADQIVVSPGVLRETWTDNGRRYFHYHSDGPTMFGADIFSAKWSAVKDRWNPAGDSAHGVSLEVFHDPAHGGDNVDRTLRSMQASFDYYTKEFGPYQYDHLTFVEIPRYGGFGRAMPGNISFTEDYFISRVQPGEIDQPFYGTAHEIAHQWWGGQLKGANMPGRGFLSESLANYSAMMLIEKTFGVEAARKVYGFQMERYFAGRARQSHEVPVLDVGDQAYIAYRKGAIAMYTLRQLIGEEAVNGALRRFVAKHRGAGPPYPTARDLYAELRAATPDSLRPLLADLFETVTLWQLKMARAVYDRSPNGSYVVTIEVTAKKARADSLGKLTEIPMDDLVDIGVFAPGKGDELGAPLYLKQQRIHTGQQTIVITVPTEPAHAGIDPYRKLLDRDRDDNVFKVRLNERGGSL